MKRLVATVLSLSVLASCGGADGSGNVGTTPTASIADGTFARIQRDILDPGCAGCHSPGSASARQSGLVLTRDSSYQQMVGVPSLQQVARADGMARIRPFKSDSSLLYHKLAWIPGHHARDYGLLMPSGTTQGITAGQLEYVRRWIEAGAPRTGHVVDTLVMRDNRVQAATFTPLPAPAAGGLQLKVDSFAIFPSTEREIFVYRRLGNANELYVTRIQSKMRPGSHHLVLYSFDESVTTAPCNTRPTPNAVRDLRNPDGSLNSSTTAFMGCHIFFGLALSSEADFRFPPGVALRLPPNAALDFNLHYVNRSPAEFPGEAATNFSTTDKSQVQTVARTLNLNNTFIILAPKQRTTLTRAFPVAVRTTVLALTSHMHSMGERFEIRVRRTNGTETTVYTSTDWEHPAFTNYETPIVLQPGESLVSVITWNNVTDRIITTGLKSTDEMGIIFGYAY